MLYYLVLNTVSSRNGKHPQLGLLVEGKVILINNGNSLKFRIQHIVGTQKTLVE